MVPSARWRCAFLPKRARTAVEGKRRRRRGGGDSVVDLARLEIRCGLYFEAFTPTFSRADTFRSKHCASENTFKLDYAAKDFHVTLSRLSIRIIGKFLEMRTLSRVFLEHPQTKKKRSRLFIQNLSAIFFLNMI